MFFLTAVRNEARIIGEFLAEMHQVFGAAGLLSRLSLTIVDDASTDDTPEAIQRHARALPGLRLELLRLVSNRGNQSAMAFGLRAIAPRIGEGHLLTADADGEDDLTRLPELVRALDENQQRIVFVYRSSRADPLLVRALYFIYQRMYRWLTAQRLIPCNMMAIPGAMIPAIIGSPLLALHFSYPPLRLRLPHRGISMPRRVRYGGRSSQNIELLVHHALMGLTIFYEQVVARLMFLAAGIVAFTSLLAAAVLVVRVLRPDALPTGFASVVFALLLGFGFTSIVLLVLFCLTCSIFRLLIEVNRDA